MKKIFSLLLIIAISLSLSSCHRIVSRVEFVVDGEVVETYFGPSRGLTLFAIEREGYEFYGWYTAEGGEGEKVTNDSIGNYFGFFPTLRLYGHLVAITSTPDTPGENQPPTTPSNPENPDSDENLDNIEPGDPWDDVVPDDSNKGGEGTVDGGGWTDVE
jgi:hypothetical protein